MVDLKKQDFWPKINRLKGYALFCEYNELQFVKKCQNYTYFQNQMIFFSFKNINSGQHTLVKTFFLNSLFKALFLKSFLILDKL